MNESTLRALLLQNGIREEDLLRILKTDTPRFVDEQVESDDRFAKLESECGLSLNSTSAKNIIADANKDNELHERNAEQDSQPDQIRNNRYPIAHVDGSAAQQQIALSGNQDQLSEKPLSKMPTVNAQNADEDVLVYGVSRAKLIKWENDRKGTDDYELAEGPELKNLVCAFKTSQTCQAKNLHGSRVHLNLRVSKNDSAKWFRKKLNWPMRVTMTATVMTLKSILMRLCMILANEFNRLKEIFTGLNAI